MRHLQPLLEGADRSPRHARRRRRRSCTSRPESHGLGSGLEVQDEEMLSVRDHREGPVRYTGRAPEQTRPGADPGAPEAVAHGLIDEGITTRAGSLLLSR